MPLEMRKTSKWWYGRYNANGKVHCVNLKIEITGVRPDSISQEGDKAFERSRGKALEKFETMVRDVKAKKQSAEFVQKLHEIRTGRRIDSIPIATLSQEWDLAARKRKGSPRYVKQAHSLFNRFVGFLQSTYPKAETLADVTPEMAEAFMRGERDRGVSGRTFNAALILLRSAFKVLSQKANIAWNPFAGITTADEDTAHRQPFNQEELKAIVAAAEQDPFIRPIIVTGICTAMRRGDCCMLRWADVDLKEKFVRVKTAKTGETVEIPMLPMLEKELERHVANGSEYVLPKQAEMALKQPERVSRRVRKVFAAAGFYNEPEDNDVKTAHDGRPLLQGQDLLTRGLEAIQRAVADEGMTAKRERMTEVFRLYSAGTGMPTVAKRLGLSKASVSNYLHELEALLGARIVRGNDPQPRVAQRGDVSIEPKTGVRRVSIRDFHSFRVTWITLALAAGVPMELVTRVTGHQTVDVVLKHYFRPGREHFRQAIEGAMPKLLMEGNTTCELPEGPGANLEEAVKAAEAMTAQNWLQQRDAVIMSIRRAQTWLDGHVLKATE